MRTLSVDASYDYNELATGDLPRPVMGSFLWWLDSSVHFSSSATRSTLPGYYAGDFVDFMRGLWSQWTPSSASFDSDRGSHLWLQSKCAFVPPALSNLQVRDSSWLDRYSDFLQTKSLGSLPVSVFCLRVSTPVPFLV